MDMDKDMAMSSAFETEAEARVDEVCTMPMSVDHVQPLPEKGSACRFCPPASDGPMNTSDETELSHPMSVSELVLRRTEIASDLTRDEIDREFSQLVEQTAYNEEPGAIDPSHQKNRYFNVFPYEVNRVKLRGPDDYINASYIDGEAPDSHHRYICTQGPLPDTIVDFWSMVWQENSSVVVMLTAESENGGIKSEVYWPVKVGGVVEYCDANLGSGKRFAVLLVDQRTAPGAPDVVVRLLDVTLVLDIDGKSVSETRRVLHVQYPDWRDFGVPSGTEGVRVLLKTVRDHEASIARRRTGVSGSAGAGAGGRAPLVVHCSAGIGRTGVFVAIHSTLERLRALEPTRSVESGAVINMPHTIARLRSQRAGMVQTVEQYRFTYRVIADTCSLAPGDDLGKPLRQGETGQKLSYGKSKKLWK